ncbi:MAG: hypothetical protein ACC619_06505 [Paracoccaceae bacterium]
MKRLNCLVIMAITGWFGPGYAVAAGVAIIPPALVKLCGPHYANLQT